MKSMVAKGALALSVLGFTFGSNVVYEHQSVAGNWSPSIFRTIANAVEFESVTAENVDVELSNFKKLVEAHKESRSKFHARLDAEETGLSELIQMRDEEVEELGVEGTRLLTRSADFRSFFSDKAEHENKPAFDALSKEMVDFYPAEVKEKLNTKISKAQESELLEQKAALAATSERICENKGLLEDIKGQIAELLKDKEEVVAEVDEEAEVDADASVDGFSADVMTYAQLFAHIQGQQNSFFEVSPPALLSPAGNDPFSMFMLMSMMNRPQAAAPRSQVNTYYFGGQSAGFGFGGYPGIGSYGGFAAPELESRNPAASSMPRLMPVIDGVNYTQTVPTAGRGNVGSEFFSF